MFVCLGKVCVCVWGGGGGGGLNRAKLWSASVN